ncbi:MAG: pyridoxine 5'-phosphate synthase [Elusimicrobia bacterium]|nr:pyridoxine 5'-phosphate synthase [Elusimicrobiota bacterium]
MPKLGVNIDHIATLRQARREAEPDPVQAAVLVELAGAHGIVVHLREDRRHIQDRDVRLLRQVVRTQLSLEMAVTDEMVRIASEVLPDQVCFVPERRTELTTEGGLDAIANRTRFKTAVKRLKDTGIRVSLFLDPDLDQIKLASVLAADAVELHTGRYANAKAARDREREFTKLLRAGELVHKLGLALHAGHGLTYRNVGPIARLPEVQELNIGFSIVARAAMVGLERAVREMLEAMGKV